ncbi:MAG: glycosyl hydrolase [Candidatus Binataceae bacterium]
MSRAIAMMETSMGAGVWDEAIDRMLARVRDTAGRVGDGFPHWADPESGRWTVTVDGDWTGGFWVAMLWLACRGTGEGLYRRWARQWAGRLRPRIASASVFKAVPFYYGGTLGHLLLDDAGARELALAAAASLMRLYNPALGLIPLGAEAEEGAQVGPAESSIDSLFASPFLLWAAHQTGDSRMLEVARSHAGRVIELHLREDGSFIQSSSLDPQSGAVLRHYTHKGYSNTSTWGRAQSWGVLLSVMSYARDPAQTRWLQTAERGADWWIAHVPSDHVAFWDFDDPRIPEVERDTAATAAMACAMLKLAALADPAKRHDYRHHAEATVKALTGRYLTPVNSSDRRIPGILIEGCFNKRPDSRSHDAAVRNELIFGSYYLFEALHILAGKADPKNI